MSNPELTIKFDLQSLLSIPEEIGIPLLKFVLSQDDGHIREMIQQALRESIMQAASEEPSADDHLALPWTYEELSRIWKVDSPGNVKLTPGAKQVLSIIAAERNGCTMSEIQERLIKAESRPITPRVVGGRLSSVGAVHKEFASRKKLYYFDGEKETYRMTAETAEIIQKLKVEDVN